MKIFLDTSSLIKLYFFEDGTIALENFISDNKIDFIFLSKISLLEFESTWWKKVRTKELIESEVKTALEAFEIDKNKFIFIPISNNILRNAQHLLSKYGLDGLRTLDSIQLSCCLEIRSETDKYFTADKLLLNIFEKENLPT